MKIMRLQRFFTQTQVSMGMVALTVLMSGCMGSSSSSNEQSLLVQQKIDIDRVQLENKKNIVPILIIGSGPAGMTAAYYAARAGFYTVVMQGNKPGGLLTETTYIENWPGRKKVLGADLMLDLADQAKSFGAVLVDDAIVQADLTRWPYLLKTSDGTEINALSVVIATGATPRTLNVPGEKEYWGKGVTTCAVCDAPFYKNKDVVISGGGDSAAEQALQLSPHVRQVTMLVRKDAMRASQAMQNHVAALTNVKILFNREIRAIEGDGEHVNAISVFDNANNELSTMPIDGVFLAIGHEPNTKLFKDAVQCDKAGYVLVDGRSQQTSLPGVFAAGDVEDKIYRQAGIAAGDGIKASLDVQQFLQNTVGLDATLTEQLKNQFFTVQKAAPSLVTEIASEKEYEQDVLASKVPVILDFYAEHCPSCMHMLPAYEAIAQQFAGKIKCIKVDIDQAYDIVRRLQVLKVPCFVVVSDGQIVARQHTVMDRTQMAAFVQQFIS